MTFELVKEGIVLSLPSSTRKCVLVWLVPTVLKTTIEVPIETRVKKSQDKVGNKTKEEKKLTVFAFKITEMIYEFVI